MKGIKTLSILGGKHKRLHLNLHVLLLKRTKQMTLSQKQRHYETTKLSPSNGGSKKH